MKTYSHLLLILALLMITAGCEDDKNREYTAGGGGDSDFHMTLVLKIPAVTDITRTLSVADETTIHSLDILVFTNKTNNEGFLYHAHGTDFIASGSTSTASVMLKESPSGEQHNLILIANLREEIAGLLADGDITEGMTKEDVLELITFDTSSPWDVVTPRYLPMWGESGYRTLSAAAPKINNIRMLRSVATVDVILAPNAKDGDRHPAAFSDFTLKTLKVCNVSKQGLVAPESTNYNTSTSKVTLPTVPTGTTKANLIYDFSTQFATDFRISREIYLTESSNNDPSEAHTDMTCILISGYYGAGNTTEETWYRLDFIEDKVAGDRFDILRNHRYTFYITAVEGPGYNNEDEALQSAPFNIQSQIIVWDDNEAGDTWVDGIYYLSIRPETVYSFHSDADESAVRIKTDVPDGFKITKITEEDGTIIDSGWLSVDKQLDTFYGTNEAQVEVTIEVEENSTGSPRTGYIYIKAGRIEAKLTVIQGIDPKRSVIFNFIEYINVDGTGLDVPAEGGQIKAIVNGNVGWKLKTSIRGVEDSMSDPASDIAEDYTLSVTFPHNNSWEELSTKVWVEYEGIAFQETTFTQEPGYYVDNTSATAVTDASGGTSTVTITGSVPELQIRAISEGVEIATGTTSAGTPEGTGTLSIPSTDEDREITIQYSKDGGITWIDIDSFTQVLSNSIAGKFAKSNIVWDGLKLTFATSIADNADIPANSQGVLFKWGSLIAISPAARSGTTATYTAGQYPNGHIIYSPTGTYSYSWANIPYANETTGMFGTHDVTEDDFASYNNDTGFNASAGKGDICRYISAQGWVAGNWRMPTAAEYDELLAEETSVANGGPFTNITVTPSGNDRYHYGYYQPASGRWLGTGVVANGSETAPTVGLFFPAGGHRTSTNGTANGVGSYGYVWSGSSGSTPSGFTLFVDSSTANRSDNHRQIAFPLRCVQE